VTERSNGRGRQTGATARSAAKSPSASASGPAANAGASGSAASKGPPAANDQAAKGPVAKSQPANGGTGLNDRFREIADRITHSVGSPIALVVAIALILLWGVTGPIFGFSDSWQLVINTTTTIITFLMVFVIQTSQNRDGRAIQLKLDELIRANAQARNRLMATEKGPEEELNALEEEFEMTAEGKRRRVQRPPASRPSTSTSRSSRRSTGR
jgi:low affinity Fe/Cu permease